MQTVPTIADDARPYPAMQAPVASSRFRGAPLRFEGRAFKQAREARHARAVALHGRAAALLEDERAAALDAHNAGTTLERHPKGDRAVKRRPHRVNPWTPQAHARRKAASLKLAAALDALERRGRATDVRHCGATAVAVDAGGALICSARTQIPTAVVFECGHRLCSSCAARGARKAARRISARLAQLAGAGADDAPGSDTRFITLTQPARPGEHARAALDRLELAVKKLMRSVEWSRHVDGGVLKFEIEWSTAGVRRDRASALDAEAARLRADGADGSAMALERRAVSSRGQGSASWWHAHAHILVLGTYWDQRRLLARWREALLATGVYELELDRVRRGELAALGGARIEAPRKRQGGLALEICKYVSKPLQKHLRHAQLIELLEALGGRHKKISAFEEWKAALDSAQRRELKRAAKRSGTSPGRRVLRSFGCMYGLRLDDDRATSTPEGFDAEGADLDTLPIGVSTSTGHVVMSRDVTWSTAAAHVEERRAIRELIHSEHERKKGWVSQ